MAMNFAAFNQDHSHLAVGRSRPVKRGFVWTLQLNFYPVLGTTKGFRIYYTDPFSKAYETQDGDITLLEMLFSTSLVALVMSPRRLIITNTKVGLFATALFLTGFFFFAHRPCCNLGI